MKIKLTESQFKRIILSEQDSKPITNLVIAQGDPKSKIEVGASKLAKSVGLVDIIVTPDMDTKDENGRGNKFEVLPYIKDDVSMGVQSLQHDLSRKKLNNLLKNIG